MASQHKTNLNGFLKASKCALIDSNERITMVSGNESCDLDSMTSAILYAWFRSNDPPSKAFSEIYVPLLNIPQEDIKLRPEFKALFSRCNISSDNLATLSDLPPPDKLLTEQTQWVLVDHNKLEGDLGNVYSSRVVGCIDHHEDENAVPKQAGAEPRVIEKSGSCTSLIIRELAQELLKKDSVPDSSLYSQDVLKLAIASILIDTHDLQDEHKTTAVDIEVAHQLDNILSRSDSTWQRESLFKEISEAKKNLDGLSVMDILRKDYKQWTENGVKLGTSSFIRPLNFLYELSKEESSDQNSNHWSTIIGTFMQDRNLDLWAIMSAFTTPDQDGKVNFGRQLEVHWLDEKGKDLVDRFEERYAEELGLTKSNSAPPGNAFKSWNQGNLAASRKQIAPILRNVMKTHAKM